MNGYATSVPQNTVTGYTMQVYERKIQCSRIQNKCQDRYSLYLWKRITACAYTVKMPFNLLMYIIHLYLGLSLALAF